MNWDEYFVHMLYLVAMKSKDEKTQNSTIIVGPDNEIRSTGYNSFPRGIDDTRPERQERPEKYYWHEHGERNAIYNASRVGIPLKGCRLYVTGIPCMDCARGIIQAGITEVIYHVLKEYEKPIIWDEHKKRTLQLFKESGIQIRKYEGALLDSISVRRDGEYIKVF
jgi:dCMP deaminase